MIHTYIRIGTAETAETAGTVFDTYRTFFFNNIFTLITMFVPMMIYDLNIITSLHFTFVSRV